MIATYRNRFWLHNNIPHLKKDDDEADANAVYVISGASGMAYVCDYMNLVYTEEGFERKFSSPLCVFEQHLNKFYFRFFFLFCICCVCVCLKGFEIIIDVIISKGPSLI